MQIISLEQLQELALHSTLHEDENDSIARLYDEFKKEYANIYKQIDAMGSLMPEEASYKIILEGWIKDHCPPIKLIGEGSSRAAFAFIGGRCLKIATNEIGYKQNNSEAKNTMSEENKDYLVFAKTYAKADDGSSLLTECCSPITYDKWNKLWNVVPHKAIDAADLILGLLDAFHTSECNWKKCFKLLRDKDPEYMQFAEKVKARKTAAMKVVATLLDFYAASPSHWKDLLVSDLYANDNWGAAIRFGEIVPVVIDAGWSEDASSSKAKLLFNR